MEIKTEAMTIIQKVIASHHLTPCWWPPTGQDLYRHGVVHLYRTGIAEKDSAKIYDSE